MKPLILSNKVYVIDTTLEGHMKIHNLETLNIQDSYVSSEYIIAIESHLSFLKSTASYETVSKQQTYKFEGDFYGLLKELKYEPNYFYAIMRVNDLVNSSDYKGTNEMILIPDVSEIDKIVSMLETKNT